MNLYEIQSEIYYILENLVDLETGEISEEAIEQLRELSEAYELKLENVACYIKSLEAEQKAIKEEIASLQARAKTKEKKAERLREYIAEVMKADGREKLETSRAVLSFRKSEAVEVADVEKLPAIYLRVKTEYSADKKALKEALKAGEEIAGATLVTKQNLQIK